MGEIVTAFDPEFLVSRPEPVFHLIGIGRVQRDALDEQMIGSEHRADQVDDPHDLNLQATGADSRSRARRGGGGPGPMVALTRRRARSGR